MHVFVFQQWQGKENDESMLICLFIVLTAEEKGEKEAKKKRKRKEKREEEKKEKEEREKGERERERLFAAASTSRHLARDELLVEQFPGLRAAGGVPRGVAEARGFLSLPLVHLGRERR